MAAMFPIIVELPNGVSGNRVNGVPAAVELVVFEVDGFLRALTTGPHVVRVRDPITNTTIDTITFNAAGVVQHLAMEVHIAPDSGLVFDVVTPGVGALDCTITVWCQVP